MSNEHPVEFAGPMVDYPGSGNDSPKQVTFDEEVQRLPVPVPLSEIRVGETFRYGELGIGQRLFHGDIPGAPENRVPIVMWHSGYILYPPFDTYVMPVNCHVQWYKIVLE